MTTKLLIKRQGDAPDTQPLDEKTFSGPIINIGSDAAASLTLSGAGIAPEQALVINEDGHMLLINRADGTFLNDEALAREARRSLTDGDQLRIGEYLIVFLFPQAAQTAQAAPLIDTRGARTHTGDESSADPLETPPFPTIKETPATNNHEKTQRNFASILDSLRTDEDTFYFLTEGGTQNERRITIAAAEMPVGWDETGQNLAFDTTTVAAPRAIVRKDWSGVIVQAHTAGMVAVNGEPVDGARRLRSGDRLMIVPTATTTAQNQSLLIFHEPASLVVLDSLLPQKLPPPVPLPSTAETISAEQAAQQSHALASSEIKINKPARKFLGYFTLNEILIMIVGTLILSVLVFLFLEYL